MKRQGARVLGGMGLAAALVTISGACSPGFESSSLVTEMRLIALKAEPPEVAPGETLSWQGLVVAPDSHDEDLIWLINQCTLTSGGCLEYVEALEAAEGDEQAAQLAYAAAALRVGGGSTYNETMIFTGQGMRAPATLLDGSDDPLGGETIQATMTVCAAEVCETEAGEGATELDLGEEAPTAIKRARVSTQDEPNHNPTLTHFSWEVGAIAGSDEGGDAVELSPGDELMLAVHLEDGAVEAYDFVTKDGSIETRVERPYVEWYATGGTFVATSSAVITDDGPTAYAEVTWLSPDDYGADELITVHAVIRDRRGGADWRSIEIRPLP